MHFIQAINKTYEDEGLYIGFDSDGNRCSVTFSEPDNDIIIGFNGFQMRVNLNDVNFKCFYKKDIP